MQDQSPKPKHGWNRIPDEVRRKVDKLALKETDLLPRELAVTFTDKERYFVSEASTYWILKAHDIITSPAFIVIKAASEFKDSTTAINQLWQTDFIFGLSPRTGSNYVSGELVEWLQEKGMKHSRGAPYHQQTQGKIVKTIKMGIRPSRIAFFWNTISCS